MFVFVFTVFFFLGKTFSNGPRWHKLEKGREKCKLLRRSLTKGMFYWNIEEEKKILLFYVLTKTKGRKIKPTSYKNVVSRTLFIMVFWSHVVTELYNLFIWFFFLRK